MKFNLVFHRIAHNFFSFKNGENSTFDGLAKVIRSKRLFLKIFWSLIICILIAICSFFLINGILNYLAYEIVTVITVRSEIPSEMPTVILCNSNGLTTSASIYWASYVQSLYGIYIKDNFLHFDYLQTNYEGTLNYKESMLLPRTMVMSAALDKSLSDDFRKSLGLTIQDMLISCTFNSIECTSNNFIWLFDSYFGNCFKFRPPPNQNKISQSGKYNGLNMELFVGEVSNVVQVAKNSGVNIFIVNETVRHNTFSDGFFAAAGKETNLLVDKKKINKIKKPYGACTPDLTSIDSYPTFYYRRTFEIYNKYRQKDVAKKCSDCPLECDSEFYAITTSSLDYPTKVYAEMLAKQMPILNRFNNNTPSYERLKQSILSVNINYNQLSYTNIKESQKITILDLATNIGGTMGLFLGISFISFFEIIMLIIELIVLIFEQKYSKFN